jgi:mono/diheme cytochrome c family protein
MRKVLKWIGIVFGGLLALIVIALAATYIIAGERINKNYDISPEQFDIPEQVEISRQNWPLMLIDFCTDCHGPNLAGQVMDDDPLFGTLVSANLTSGIGGIGGTFSDADWIRALRHGVDNEGKPLVVMPAETLGKLSDQDLAIIIAYVKNFPPVDSELPEIRLGLLARLFMVTGLAPDLLSAELIDHDAERPPDPVPGASAAYGEYLAFMCTVCHTEDLSGGPGAGEGMNLTPGGQLADWSEEDFIQTIRTGVAPDGVRLDDEEMPWRILGRFSDQEFKAIWLYLQSLPAVETEHR